MYRGGGPESGRKKFEECLPAGTGTKIYFSNLRNSAAQKSHRKNAVNTVAASGLASIPLQKSQGFLLRRPLKNRKPLAIFGVSLKIAGKSPSPPPSPFDFTQWNDPHPPLVVYQKTREGCGCPKFPAGKVFRQISTLLENSSPIFRQREMLSLPRFGHFPARKRLLENWPRLRERCWIFSSETATAFLSSSESKSPLLFHTLCRAYERKHKTTRKGRKRGTTRNFLHSFPLSGGPVVQSYWARKFLRKKTLCFRFLPVDRILLHFTFWNPFFKSTVLYQQNKFPSGILM